MKGLNYMDDYLYIFLLIASGFIIVLLLISIYILYHSYKIQDAVCRKFKRNFLLMETWMNKKRMNEYFIADKLKSYGHMNIAIYGVGYLGMQLYKDLTDSEIVVKYCIDNRLVTTLDNLPVYKPNEELPEVDAIIITAISSFFSIKKKIEKKNQSKILTLEDLIN